MCFAAQQQYSFALSQKPIVENAKHNAENLCQYQPVADADLAAVSQACELALHYSAAVASIVNGQEACKANALDTKNITSLCDADINAAIAKYQEAKRIAAEKQRIANIQNEIASRPGMVGRLIISSVGIDVALIAANDTAGAQAVVDAADSCAYISSYIPGAIILADHSNQDFSGLRSVSVGTKGQIVTSNGTINIVASTVFNGHNFGYLTDANGAALGAIAPYIAYTCIDNWQNVRIVGWSIC